MALVVAITIAPSNLSFAIPYDWKNGEDGTVSRCFKVKNIKAECEDLSDPSRNKKKIAELQISAKDLMGRKFIYSYERGIEGSLCSEQLRKIKSLVKKTPEVCITGGVEWFDENDGTTCSKWRALETAKGRIIWY